ncbi:MAG: hypothetical protein ACOX05_00160 [Bacillota bacterium]|jgi:hypothetical protein
MSNNSKPPREKEKINIKPVSTPPRIKKTKQPVSEAFSDSSINRDKLNRSEIINNVLKQLQPEDPTELGKKDVIKPQKTKSSYTKEKPSTISEQAVKPAPPEREKKSRPKTGTSDKQTSSQKTKAVQQAFSAEENIALKKWMLIIFLTLIPIVNIIFTIIWIKKPQIPPVQKTFARAALIWIAIGWVALIAAFAIISLSLLSAF